jgi:glutamate--cysteine ligase
VHADIESNFWIMTEAPMETRKQDPSTLMTAERTWEFLEKKTFRLQPEAYQEAHPDWPGAVGLEIEMLPLYADDPDQPRRVPLQGKENSLAALLRDLSLELGYDLSESDDKSMLFNVFLDDHDNLSFEPGGQLEFSSKPYGCLSQATQRTKDIQSLLDKELAHRGHIALSQVGINPWHSVQDIGLQMTKPRYRAMNEFFSHISDFGPRMMRQTCTVQVNLDFGKNQETMAKRYLASQMIAPYVGAIFNYSGWSEHKLQDRTGFRSEVWRHLDGSRTGIQNLNHLLLNQNKQACVQTYFDFLMQARVVFVTSLNYKAMLKPITWNDWMLQGIDGVYPTLADFETHLSLLFPEVRARGFLELRSVDCQSRQWQFVPAAWWTGILYDDRSCQLAIDLLTPHVKDISHHLHLASFGLRDDGVGILAQRLTTLALEGLGRLPKCYFGHGAREGLTAFANRFTFQRRVPTQDVWDVAQKTNQFNLNTFKSVEDVWSKL